MISPMPAAEMADDAAEDADWLAADGSVWVSALPPDWSIAAAPPGGEFGLVPTLAVATRGTAHARTC